MGGLTQVRKQLDLALTMEDNHVETQLLGTNSTPQAESDQLDDNDLCAPRNDHNEGIWDDNT